MTVAIVIKRSEMLVSTHVDSKHELVIKIKTMNNDLLFVYAV